MAVKEVISDNMASHHFEIQNRIKDVGIEDMFKRMYSHKFNEGLFPPSRSQGDETSISWEDKRFLSLMDKSAKRIEDHYELPLLLRKDQKRPNNRHQALKRLKHLKNKLERNPIFFGHHKELMDTLFQRGHTRKSSKPPAENKCWYVPHHGVYNDNKLNKIRVVFDCSAEYKGASLNNELMSGPDLTNQILGVLMRFGQESMAMMADIESMFLQVCVPEEHQNFLRFLWWENHNLKR